MSQNFSLKWNQFERKLSHSFIRLREEGDFLDVTLIADDGEQVQAHKNVLSSCSEFFKSILKTIPHHHPVIYLSGIRAENLLLALDYIYHGEVKISKDSLYDFLRVAQKLKLEELKVDIDNDITDLNELNDPNDLNDLNDQNTIENDCCSWG